MDRQGRVWIGTDGGGINVFEGEKRIAIYKKESGNIPSNFILASLQDSKVIYGLVPTKGESAIMITGIKNSVPSLLWGSLIRMFVRSMKMPNTTFG